MEKFMFSGRHEHQCQLCKRRFECLQITHCRKMSDDPDIASRPICYQDDCRIARDALIEREAERSNAILRNHDPAVFMVLTDSQFLEYLAGWVEQSEYPVRDNSDLIVKRLRAMVAARN